MKYKTLRCLRSVFLAALFVLSVAAPSLAQETRSGHEFDYYSDDTYTCLVGVYIYCSDGALTNWGSRTPYSIVSDSGC